MWAMKKEREEEEIKDAYPKKVCHMLKRHIKKRKKDEYPKKVCHMLTRHVEKKERKKEKDSPHSSRTKKRDRSCKGVHPSSTKKENIPHTCTS